MVNAILPSSSQQVQADTNQTNGHNNGIIEATKISISGTRPIQLGVTLRSPTNMSFKGALSLTDGEYLEIRDSIDAAIQNEEYVRNLDLDSKQATEEQRNRFCELVGSYLTSRIAGNDHLVHKLTIRYKDVSPWLIYKFVLLRRKRYRAKCSGSNEEIDKLPHSTIDIGNPEIGDELENARRVKEQLEKGPRVLTLDRERNRPNLLDARRLNLLPPHIRQSGPSRALIRVLNDTMFDDLGNISLNDNDLSDVQPLINEQTEDNGPPSAENNPPAPQTGMIHKAWTYVLAVSSAFVSFLLGVWYFKANKN